VPNLMGTTVYKILGRKKNR